MSKTPPLSVTARLTARALGLGAEALHAGLQPARHDDLADVLAFRRQHLEKFLPGLAKLGLSALPHAVACAQYHYLSNHLGGVRVEYMYESDRKA